MELRFHVAALEELDGAIRHYDGIRAGLGQELHREVMKTIEAIRENPKIGGSVGADIRRRNVARFPYGIIFKATDSDVTIYAIMHHKRKPGYWRKRVR